jgi:hypothetical protein
VRNKGGGLILMQAVINGQFCQIIYSDERGHGNFMGSLKSVKKTHNINVVYMVQDCEKVINK